MPCRLLVFDLDGTLVDSRADIAASANSARAELSFPPLPEEQVARYIGSGIFRLMEQVLLGSDEATVRKGVELFRRHYRLHCLDRTRLYPGVIDVLRALSDRKMAVVSNKPKSFAAAILKGLDVDAFFSCTLGGDSVPQRKPHPLPIRMVLEELKVEPGDGIVIGDSDVDVRAGRDAGCRTCGVTWGIGDLAALRASGPDILIDRVEQLVEVVRAS